MNLQLDNREQSRIKSATKYYKEQGVEVTVEELEVGDYVFDNKVAFEFKTIPDFVSSIQSNRVFNQAISQAETYPYHFVIIQGDESTRAKALAMSKHYREVTYYDYLGAIASLNRYTTVIESYSPYINEAYYRMLTTAKKCIQNKPIVKKFPKKNRNPCLNYLCYCVYGLNAKRATQIVNELDLNNLTDLQQLTIEQLTQIEGIGEKTANNIINSIK